MTIEGLNVKIRVKVTLEKKRSKDEMRLVEPRSSIEESLKV